MSYRNKYPPYQEPQVAFRDVRSKDSRGNRDMR